MISEAKLLNYISTLSENVQVDNVKILSTQRKGNGELLFATLEIKSDDVLPFVFVKGDGVSIVPIITAQNAKYFLCVEQRRIADGKIHCEFPAGMMDTDCDPLAVVIKELEEETGIKIKREDVETLNDGKPLFTSPGACDEKIYFFKTEISLTANEFSALQNKIIDNGDEKIIVKLYTEEELQAKTVSCITFAALNML
ncbi:MAG: NUDIX domain-containing protein [Chitinivibrionia bacterium]|nr:NUDIX domain-containing protein [Chitinivibrionia bacterium]